MPGFLLFRLYGPFASWGEIAVGERRGSWSRPSKSAVLGLVAASLGIERHEPAPHAALASGYGFAVRVDSPGVPLKDYHTAQTARETDLKKIQKAFGRPLTRRLELSVGSPETILSDRDYYTDALYHVALWTRTGAPYRLDELQTALRRPRLALYLGRKSCPPALPLVPEVVEADDLWAALQSYRPAEPAGLGAPLAMLLNRRGTPAILAWEDDVVPETVLMGLHTERRRDEPGDRLRRQFAERVETVAVLR
jgi:CRISPR system Cascade subunit CasD